MSEHVPRHKTPGHRLIFAGRVIATAYIVFFLLIALAEAIAEGVKDVESEGVALALLLVFMAIAVALAWRDASRGALALAVAGTAFGIFVAITAGHNRVPTSIGLAAPYLVSSALTWFGTRRALNP